jgi:hypothetical protein
MVSQNSCQDVSIETHGLEPCVEVMGESRDARTTTGGSTAVYLRSRHGCSGMINHHNDYFPPVLSHIENDEENRKSLETQPFKNPPQSKSSGSTFR